MTDSLDRIVIKPDVRGGVLIVRFRKALRHETALSVLRANADRIRSLCGGAGGGPNAPVVLVLP